MLILILAIPTEGNGGNEEEEGETFNIQGPKARFIPARPSGPGFANPRIS
jgi:hypothetical protein